MQFVYPKFLYALLFVAIPILLHLLRLRKYKTVYFSNVRFLHTLDVEQKKRSHLRDLLVLLARIMTIVALVLAFAQPYLPRTTQMQPSQGEKYISIYVDNSFSMESNGRELSLLDQAKEYAKQILSAYDLSDKFQLLTNDFAGEQQRFMNKEECLDALENIDYSPFPRTWTQVRMRQRDAFEALFIPENKRFSYLISDFQKGSMQLTTFSKEDSVASICLMPLASEMQDNIGIDSIYLDAPIMEKGRECILSVCLRNRSAVLQEKIPVKLIMQEKNLALLNVDIPANGTKIVSFPIQIQADKWHYGEVEIDDFPISYDNKMYFSFPVKESVRVLHIYEDRPNSFLQKIFAKDPSFSYTASAINQLNYTSIAQSDFIILDELKQMPTALKSELDKRMLQTAKICFIPNRTPSGHLDPSLQAYLDQSLHVQYQNFDTSQMQVQKIESAHILFKTAFEKEPKNLWLPYVKGFYPIKNRGGNLIQNLLLFQNHFAFLSEVQKDKGFVYLFATPLQEVYTDFCDQALFVVCFVNMALITPEDGLQCANIGGQEILYVQAPDSKAKEVVVCTAMEGDFSILPEWIRMGGEIGIVPHNQIQKEGHYCLTMAKDTLAILSFNYNRQESDNEFYTKEELKQRIHAQSMKNMSVLLAQSQNVKTQIEALNKGLELWKIFLIFALVFILSEIALIRLWK
ncbi:MAG: BatA domain-containing protein [Bacteroidales bacterium]